MSICKSKFCLNETSNPNGYCDGHQDEANTGYTLITGEEYMDLKDPEFKGQSRPDTCGMYYMYWESEGKMYKTHNRL